MVEKQSVLIATLGTEAQVVTIGLYWLLRQGEHVQRVVVLHTSSEDKKMQVAITRLEDEFPVLFPECQLSLLQIKDVNGHPVQDVVSDGEIQAAFRSMYQQVHQAKLQDMRVHLLVAGGRKTLTTFGMVTAQLLFDEDDCLWYLYSKGKFLDSREMVPKEDDYSKLVAVPVILWSSISPALNQLADIDDPELALKRVRELQLTEKYEHARAFVEEILSKAEARVVEKLVMQGWSDKEIAENLFISHKTVGSHLEKTYQLARNHWGLEIVTAKQIIKLLSFYYEVNAGGEEE